MNPAAPELELQRLLEVLEAETDALGALVEDAARSEVAHKTVYAKMYLKAEGPVETRKALAEVATESDLLSRRVAEARYHAQRELLATLRSEIDGMRSLLVNQRAATG